MCDQHAPIIDITDDSFNSFNIKRENQSSQNDEIEELKIESLSHAKANSKKKLCKFGRFRHIYKGLLNRCLEKLHFMLNSGCTELDIFISKSNKQARSKNSKHPEKRSAYIGVSKNGKNWQSLVCYKKEKVYLNTLSSERVAGELFDFFTILNHFNKGKVNHTYTIRDTFKVNHLSSQSEIMDQWFRSSKLHFISPVTV